MPFTFAHPALVLPLKQLPKRWISMTALVMGSMVPDFEYFFRMRVRSIYSHTLSGLLWFDLPVGLLLFLVYHKIVKDKLIDHLPIQLKQRLSKFKGNTQSGVSPEYIAVIVISILIGSTSHLLWDSFTHPAGYFVMAIPVLTYTIHIGDHQLYGYKLAQHASTVLGGAAILWALLIIPKDISSNVNDISGYWLKVLSITIAVTTIRLICGLNYHEYGNLVVTSIAGMFIGLVVVSYQHTTEASQIK
ncbi:DUF4184 family protein [Mucilaginibacter sp. SG564]|uniref:DUF4184 family protein n=1 Tax=Mucilaginibacter sp. SG564 TaxID=2587022 RepID=UPI001552BF0E|nr:DUF4184 family protein [Mucilaginibacter sp. SG564]NOW94529.1 vacuolar-type H+-ATPase subunit I/STV1 [Mucilaginibacter sp. SG564]